ncbi:SNF2 family N-terminal domain-domain-containing protein [Catenaria anguillulae PL171]|uniref:SNF2 family N-terminal domain-domain-containing protein n=1 Tax=Catenaria anguillulae PL171 TaxID=765915 RepID=A0A1Y2HCR5_9FUNG|nr:SNF2 family N-terminal domain-domain-containing protein [Catenaria anguillulae PL171]
MHNPSTPNAFVLPRPPISLLDEDAPPVVDVVVDPILAGKLRPHQREGVRFMYECVMGYKTEQQSGQTVHGSILADDPGLGKTLMAITLIWTLLHQHPHGRSRAIGRALVVCPASLVANWAKEIKKWLGDERLATFPVTASTDINHFLSGKASRVMIVGYERLRMLQSIVAQCNFGLVVCDEGHRLKNATAKTSEALGLISTKRRVVLSGTPLQNDLMEYFAMVDYVNPGMLGTAAEFRAVYESPIVAGRQPTATRAERELAMQRARALSSVCDLFVIRRLADVNREYLPPKSEMIVFCRPTSEQARAYESVIEEVAKAVERGDTQALPWIAKLKKVCNWMQPPVAADANADGRLQSSGECSAKYHFISVLLEVVLAETQEKVVLVSNSTSTLDELQALCESLEVNWVRLDGSTSVEKRQDLVNAFNQPTHPSRVFLLSAKAGGVGLNLVGASRLVLTDIDWNPAICQQSKARVWRDGQLRPVHIYRLLVIGSLEENMAQRQINKLSLSTHIVDGAMAEAGDTFSAEDMAHLFALNKDTDCALHDALACTCSMDGSEVLEHGWRHIAPERDTGVVSPGMFKDGVTRAVVKRVGASIGFVFSDA